MQTQTTKNGKSRETAQKQRSHVVIPAAPVKTLRIRLVGTAPLVVERFGHEIRGNGTKKASASREDNAYNAMRYVDDEGRDGYPTAAIRQALVDSTKTTKGVTKVTLRGAVTIEPELALLKYDLMKPHKSVRVESESGTVLDARIHPSYEGWSTEITVRYMSSALSHAHVLAALRAAGSDVGIGWHRPVFGGKCGTFRIEEIES